MNNNEVANIIYNQIGYKFNLYIIMVYYNIVSK